MSKKNSNRTANPTTEKVVTESGEFGQKEAEIIAASYLPEGDKVPKEFAVMYITSDKTAFAVHNEGAARTHADKNKLKVFKVKNNGK